MARQWKVAMRSLLISVFIFGPLLCRVTGTACRSQGLVAPRESRRTVAHAESGTITAVDVSDGRKGGRSYHLEFFTLDTRSLFLPVLLHADMVFYVHTGTWRILDGSEHFVMVYSNVRDLVRGFDSQILQMGFGVAEDVIEKIKTVEKPPPIVPFDHKNETESHELNWRDGILEALLGRKSLELFNGKNKKSRAFNIMKKKPDVENIHGWSKTVTHKDAKSLKGSFFGMLMVNLTMSSMIGPHWNPMATEIAIVLRGRGIVEVVRPLNASDISGEDDCSTMRFSVKEGDVFVVPRFHPMAQISFSNESFVFVGFSTNVKKNHPQFLAGRWSALKVLDRTIMELSFNVTEEIMDRLLAAQEEGVLLRCDGCAEEVEREIEAEVKREWSEEEERREKEERRKEEERREEEEERRKKQKEEWKRKEEEEAARRQEEEKREEEEERRRKEEEGEEWKRKEEEEAARRQEEERRRKEEEEEEGKEWIRKKGEEEAARRREEEKREEEE
ncbi:Vicilin-like antimicrobial peptides 2-2 [Apostasia shenzhenica]|uniref:Vicilin-like antimicrobial peptides 2-2 n=1 Tax=Apostasia shenzhenica TaxID=1088818 RepID=A0A2I0ADK3_9ASPA|nr:Vicilin-like antimicrobial peptides 2-2 [Apostasia shenzhenica]